MGELSLEWFLLFGLSAGWLAGLIMGERSLGLIGSSIIGLIGAFLGGYLSRVAGLNYDGMTASFVTALAGVVTIFVLIKVARRF